MFNQRIIKLAACAAVLSGMLISPAHAIRYELIDAAAGDQDGHALTGFIEFDAPCGESCTAANIIDFSFSVTGPNEYSHSYQGPGDVFLIQPENPQFLHAGPKFLTLDFSAQGSLNFGNDGSAPVVVWAANVFVPFRDDPISRYFSIMEQDDFVWASAPRIAGPINIGVVVPEPSAFLLVLTAVVLVSSFGRTSREVRNEF